MITRALMLKYEKKITNIRYIDVNSLYGSQMLFDLPANDYRSDDKIFYYNFEKD